MSSPRTLPLIGTVRSPLVSVPESIWNDCLSVRSPCGSLYWPATRAGTIQKSAVHHEPSQLSTACFTSGCQSPIEKVLDAMRVPGLSPRSFGRSFRLMSGSRNMVMTVAFERSVSKRSACTNSARSVTPAASAFRLESATISGLYSMPSACAPRFAAVITVRPSPEPRSMT